MSLNQFAAERKRSTFARLELGLEPEEGEFDPARLAEGRVCGPPRMGSTFFRPDSVRVEFVFSGPGTTVVFPVTFASPERIVFLPVPEWVVESIWQGEIDGSHHFESDARRLLAKLAEEVEPGPNAKWFEPRPAKRRE